MFVLPLMLIGLAMDIRVLPTERWAVITLSLEQAVLWSYGMPFYCVTWSSLEDLLLVLSS